MSGGSDGSVVIEHKLESLRRCLQRIQGKCPPTAQALSRDIDAQDILALNLTRATVMWWVRCA